MTTFTRTRQSVGSQLRETLDAMVAVGQISGWEIVPYGDGRNCYRITDAFDRTENLLCGEAIEWVNAYGYDVRFGKC